MSKVQKRVADYFITGPKDILGIPHKSLGSLLQDYFDNRKNNTAVVDIRSGESLTYRQLSQLAQNLAASLSSLRINKDDVVAVVAENSHKYCVVLVAGLFLATPLHLINPDFTEYELERVLKLSNPKLVFCTQRSLKNVLAVLKHLVVVPMLVLLDDDDQKAEFLLYNNLVEETQVFTPEDEFDTNQQVAFICNSSGTTGLPKGVMLSHKAWRILFANLNLHQCFQMATTENMLLVVPMFHCYGITVLLWTFHFGATQVVLDGFKKETFLETIQNYGIKKLVIVPTLVNFLATSALTKKYDLSSVERIFTAGASAFAEDCNLLKDKLHLKSVIGFYGLTETAGLCTLAVDYSPNVCGNLLFGRCVKVTDVATGLSLPPYQEGEICISGHIMNGYINNPEKTKEAIDDEGFLHTGDWGYYDSKGCIYIVGRIKEIIKYKAFQVSPFELESIILKHPDVEDVAVVGRPHRRWGEVAVGFVVKKKGSEITEQHILDFLSTFVANYKNLHGGVRFVEKLPRNALGKILRRELEQQLGNNIEITI